MHSKYIFLLLNFFQTLWIYTSVFLSFLVVGTPAPAPPALCPSLPQTVLLSGNYWRRLITTLGSNDAAPNEIFIKDPSASN